MGYSIVNCDITKTKADIIVNASNGIGYMGGLTGIHTKLKGVAESIHFETKGVVEKEAKIACRKSNFLPRYLCGHKAGEIFVTGAGRLDSKFIIHAVTMRYPGMITNINVVKELLPKIISKTHELNGKTIEIPLLGTGTGRLSKDDVLNLYIEFFSNIEDIEVTICCN